jgi:hypothetical protein
MVAILGGALGLFRGATIRDVTLMGSQSDKYVQYQNVGILTEGEIWVQVTGTPGPGDPVHYNAGTGVFAASGGSGPVLGARWMETSENGLGKRVSERLRSGCGVSRFPSFRIATRSGQTQQEKSYNENVLVGRSASRADVPRSSRPPTSSRRSTKSAIRMCSIRSSSLWIRPRMSGPSP